MMDVKLVFEVMDGMKTDNYSWPNPSPLPIQYYCYWCSYIQSFTPLVSTKVLVFGAQNPIMYRLVFSNAFTGREARIINVGRYSRDRMEAVNTSLSTGHGQGCAEDSGREKLMYHQRQTSGQWMIRWHCDNDAVWQNVVDRTAGVI